MLGIASISLILHEDEISAEVVIGKAVLKA